MSKQEEIVRIRPLTEQEIASWYNVPEGAIRYPDIKTWDSACKELAERNVHYQAGGHHPEFGSFWAYEVIEK